jgi:hypothetical protein
MIDTAALEYFTSMGALFVLVMGVAWAISSWR